MNKSIKKQGIIAFIWDFSGRLLTQTSSFIVTIILSRILSPEDFGLIAIALLFNGISTVLADSGLGGALIKNKKNTQKDYDTIFVFNFLISIILFITIFITKDYIAIFFKQSNLSELIPFTSIGIIISSICYIHNIKLKKELKFNVLVKISFLSSFIAGLMGIIASYQNFGIWSLVIVAVSANFLRCFFLWKACFWVPKSLGSVTSFSLMWRYASNMLMISIIEILSTNLEKIALGKFISLTTLGYYERAQSFSTMVTNYTSAPVHTVLFPTLSKLEGDLNILRFKILSILNIYFLIIFFIIGIGYFSSEALILFFLTEKWSSSIDYLRILFLASFSVPILNIFGSILTSKGFSKEFLLISILNKLLLILSLILIYYYDISIYLYSLIISGIISVIYGAYITSEKMKINSKKIIFYISQPFFICSFSIFTSWWIVENNELLSIQNYILKAISNILIYTTFYFIIYKLFFPEILKNIKIEFINIVKKR